MCFLGNRDDFLICKTGIWGMTVRFNLDNRKLHNSVPNAWCKTYTDVFFFCVFQSPSPLNWLTGKINITWSYCPNGFGTTVLPEAPIPLVGRRCEVIATQSLLFLTFLFLESLLVVIVLVVGVVLNINFCYQKHHPRLLNIQDGSLERS